MLKLLTAADYRKMPWKNGLGSTTEVAIYPPGSEMTNFLWRVSIASVAGSGPFSTFPGMDRIIVQLSGPDMRLVHPDLDREQRLELLKPYVFAGELATEARIAGPATDFNVMVRRRACRADLQVINLTAAATTLSVPAGGTLFVHTVTGTLRANEVTVPAGDSVVASLDKLCLAAAAAAATAIVVTLQHESSMVL